MGITTLHWSLDVGIVVLSIFSVAYIYMTRNFSYWKKRGVTEIPPIAFFGNFLDCCLFRTSASMYLGSLYEWSKGLPYMGFYAFDRPALLLRDPDILKRVFIKDFDCFVDRYVSTDKSDTVGSGNMFLVKQPKWKGLRSKISPFFTSGKLKSMFPLKNAIGKDLVTHLDALKLQGEGRDIEMKNICAMYTIDVIISCAFGLQASTLNDPECAFRKCAAEMFGFNTYMRGAEFTAFFFAPNLVKLLKLKFHSKAASDYLRQIITKTMAMRTESNIRRNDLIDVLIQLKNSQNHIDDPEEFRFEGDNLVAQAASFFAAGFETSSSTMSFSLYELALHPEIQSKLREEIIAALAENDGEVTYEMVMNLPYLDMVLSETLRKYPSLPILDRIANRDYKMPDSDLVIEKGTPVYISLLGLHYDPEYFPDPEKYDPERFSNENKKKIPSCVYMPFGEGPRNCVGIRFGFLQVKLGLFKFIQNYEVTACARTPIPMCFDPKALLLKSKDGLFLRTRQITPVNEE